jgi:hypothetical protein
MSDTKEILPRKVEGYELKLGDTIRFTPVTEAYSDAMVEQIENGEITLVRPYMHHGDYVHTGGVTTYIGLEKFKTRMASSFLLVRRGYPIK